MSSENKADVLDKPTRGREKKARPQIQPCLIPGNYYIVEDLIEGGVASQGTFTKWFNTGKLKPGNSGCRRYVVAADDLIALWKSLKTG